jgi:hypothetical protein
MYFETEGIRRLQWGARAENNHNGDICGIARGPSLASCLPSMERTERRMAVIFAIVVAV